MSDTTASQTSTETTSSTSSTTTVATPTSIGVNQPIAPIADFNKKTLYQKVNRIITFSGFLNTISELCGGLDYEAIQGGIVEYGTKIPTNVYNFNDSAFIPTDKNYDDAGTGLVANNRNDAFENDITEKWQFEMPTPAREKNYTYSTLDYRFGKYADILLGEDFVNLAMSDIDNIIKLKRANELLFGVDMYLRKGDTSTTHYDGLIDFIKNAKADAPSLSSLTAPLPANITDIEQVDIVGYSNKYLYLGGYNYTPSGGSKTTIDGLNNLECFAQINTALKIIGSNVQTAFNYGTTSSSATNKAMYSSENDNLEKLLVWPSFLENVKASNYNFYKELSKLFDEGKLKVLPKSFPLVKFVKGDFVCKWYKLHNNSSITTGYIPLDFDEIFIYSSNSFIKHCYNFGDDFNKGYVLTKNNKDGDQIITPNNTTKHICITTLQCNAINPSGACLIIKAPAIINLKEGQRP